MRSTAVVRAGCEPRRPRRHANGGLTAGRGTSSTSMAAMAIPSPLILRTMIIRMMSACQPTASLRPARPCDPDAAPIVAAGPLAKASLTLDPGGLDVSHHALGGEIAV